MTEQKIKGVGCEGVGGSTCPCTLLEMFCLLEVVRVKCTGKSEEARAVKTYAPTHCFTVLVQRQNKRWAVNLKVLLWV